MLGVGGWEETLCLIVKIRQKIKERPKYRNLKITSEIGDEKGVLYLISKIRQKIRRRPNH